MPAGLAGLTTCWREQKTQMPTPQEIELRAQLARHDERILELEKHLKKQTFRANKFEGVLRAMRTSSAHIDRLRIANERIQELENQNGELLAALKELVNDFGRDGYGVEFEDGECRVIDMARAVIASVEGGAW